MSFNIPYPDSYNEWLEQIKVIELNMPALLPLDCLLGGISFLHTLIIQTLGPLMIIGKETFDHAIQSHEAVAASTATTAPTVLWEPCSLPHSESSTLQVR